MTQTVLLGDVCKKVTSGGTPSTKHEEYYDGNIPWLRTQEVNFGNIYSTEKTITEAGLKNSSAKLIPENSVIIAMYGATAGKSAVNKIPLTTNQACCNLIIDHDKADYRYVYYYLLSNYEKVASSAVGAAQQNLGAKQIAAMPISLPDLSTQKKIANILGGLDEKIELNRQMNQTLEQMGQALFRHHFIDNPEAERWNKRELGEFFPIKTGKKDANFGADDGEYPFFTCAQTISKAPDYSFDAHALLLAGNGDFNLKLYRGKFEAYQRTYVLIPSDEKLVGFLYFLMKDKLSEITGGSRGSVIKFITKGMIENYKIALPNDDNLSGIADIFNQTTVNIEENARQIQTLSHLRDTLLPRLISGKTRV